MDFRMSVQIMNVRCHRTVWTEVIMLKQRRKGQCDSGTDPSGIYFTSDQGAVGGVLGFIVALALLPFLVVFGIGAAVVGLFVAAVCSDRSRNWNLFYSTSVWCPSRWNWSAPVCIGTCWSCVPEMGSNLCTSGTSA